MSEKTNPLIVALDFDSAAEALGVVERIGPAIDFYKKLGATFLDDWKAVLLEGEHLRLLAEKPNR